MEWPGSNFAQLHEQALLEHNITLKLLNNSIKIFSEACIDFQAVLDHARDKQLSDNDRRILNNKLQSLE